MKTEKLYELYRSSAIEAMAAGDTNELIESELLKVEDFDTPNPTTRVLNLHEFMIKLYIDIENDTNVLYDQYCQYVSDELDIYGFDHLFQNGYLKIDTVDDFGISYRVLTKSEYLETGMFKITNHYTV